MDVYKNCPIFENENFKLRLIKDDDAEDLLKVYGDIKAVPLFNSDNCHGDDFHYTTKERMRQAVDFWKQAYENGWFVRWSIIDRSSGAVIGTVEEFLRNADDFFTDCGLLRLDLKSDFEKADKIESILSLIVKPSFDIFGCKMVATKVIASATERLRAVKAFGFNKSEEKLIGFDGTEYGDYFIFKHI